MNTATTRSAAAPAWSIPTADKTRYEYGPGGLATIVAPDGGRFGFTRDSKGRLVRLAYPNGVTGRWAYDSRGRVIAIGYYDANGAYVAGTTYSYDANGNVAARRGDLFQVRRGRPVDQRGQSARHNELLPRSRRQPYRPRSRRLWFEPVSSLFPLGALVPGRHQGFLGAQSPLGLRHRILNHARR